MNLTRRGALSVRPRRVRIALPALLFTSVGLLLLSRLDHSALNAVRFKVEGWMSPVLQAAIVPLAPLRDAGRRVAEQFELHDKLERLTTENQKLSNWEWRARQLETKLADLEALSKVVAEQRLGFVTSRVIADSSGAFARSIMIDAGRNQNIRSGYPVISAEGLVGRVVETGADSSRVLLATDLNSRIPVAIGAAGTRAILTGDNGPQPRLFYIPEGAKVASGDDVATSGTGGLFPRGLRIGAVTTEGGQLRVALRAHLDALQYVSVLLYDDPAQALSETAPAATPQPPAKVTATDAAREKRP